MLLSWATHWAVFSLSIQNILYQWHAPSGCICPESFPQISQNNDKSQINQHMNNLYHTSLAQFSGILSGKMAVIIKKTINAEVPYIPWITGYIAILVGAFMTFIVQSSSIFTSTLTPLIGKCVAIPALDLITDLLIITKPQALLWPPWTRQTTSSLSSSVQCLVGVWLELSSLSNGL